MEKRSNAEEIAHDDMHAHISTSVVGGRQGRCTTLPGGGGYLQSCTGFKLATEGGKKNRDPRLDELHDMGLHYIWKKVANEIGVDAFLAMWRVLDAEEQLHDPRGHLEITMRRYKAYRRFQRNKFIFQMASQKISLEEIHKRLLNQENEFVSIRQLKRILSGKG